MNKILEKFNKRKLDDLEIIEKCLTCPPPKFGASCNEIINETDERMNLCKNFIYYYKLLEYSNVNLKKYKDDEETIKNINEMIIEYYKQYNEVLEMVKSEKYE